MPWVIGVTLGLILGVALLIFSNATAPKTATANDEAAPAISMAEGGAATAGESDTMTNDVPESAPTVGDPATTAADETAEEGESAAAANPTDPQPAEVSEGEEQTEAMESSAVAAADADPENGAQVFASNSCAGCHGAKAEGGIGPALNQVADWSVEEFATALREGVTPTGAKLGGAMPIFTAEQIGDQEVADLHAWLEKL